MHNEWYGKSYKCRIYPDVLIKRTRSHIKANYFLYIALKSRYFHKMST